MYEHAFKNEYRMTADALRFRQFLLDMGVPRDHTQVAYNGVLAMRSGFTFTSFRDESSTDVIKISLDGRDEGGLSFGGVDQGGKPTLGSHVGELLNGWNLNDDDTLFLYIRCHGRVDNGIWYGVDPQGVSFSIEDLLKPVTMKAGTLILLVDACHSAHVVGNIQRKKLLANVGRYLVMCSSDGRHHDGNAKFSEDVLAYRRVFFTKERATVNRVPISGPFLPILLHYLSGPAEDFGDVAERVTKDLSVRGATQIKSGSLPPLHCVFPKWRRLGDQPKRPPADKVERTAKGSSTGGPRAAAAHRGRDKRQNPQKHPVLRRARVLQQGDPRVQRRKEETL